MVLPDPKFFSLGFYCKALLLQKVHSHLESKITIFLFISTWSKDAVVDRDVIPPACELGNFSGVRNELKK